MVRTSSLPMQGLCTRPQMGRQKRPPLAREQHAGFQGSCLSASKSLNLGCQVDGREDRAGLNLSVDGKYDTVSLQASLALDSSQSLRPWLFLGCL